MCRTCSPRSVILVGLHSRYTGYYPSLILPKTGYPGFRKKNDICCQFMARYKEIICMDNLKIHLDKFVRNMSTVRHLQGCCRSGVVTVDTAVDDTGHLLVVELAR